MTMYVCDYDYADKINIKDTNYKDLKHHYKTLLISTRWKHQLEIMLEMKINHLVLSQSTLVGERHGEHASNQSWQTSQGEEITDEG